VSRVPKGAPGVAAKVPGMVSVEEETEELADIATFVPRPEKATTFDPLVPLVVCQKFRDNTPVRPSSNTCPADRKRLMTTRLELTILCLQNCWRAGVELYDQRDV